MKRSAAVKSPPIESSEAPAAIEMPKPEERVRIRAYQFYEERGREDGRALEDWLHAESETSLRPIVPAVRRQSA